MDIRKLKKLVELLQQGELSELELREGDSLVRLAAARSSAVVEGRVMAFDERPAAAVEKTVEIEEQEGTVVKSPMVGTFYRANTPGGEPFVAVGQKVVSGEVICIIEAMKVFNQIRAEEGGVVRSILVDDGEPVEFEQPLLLLD